MPRRKKLNRRLGAEEWIVARRGKLGWARAGGMGGAGVETAVQRRRIYAAGPRWGAVALNVATALRAFPPRRPVGARGEERGRRNFRDEFQAISGAEIKPGTRGAAPGCAGRKCERVGKGFAPI